MHTITILTPLIIPFVAHPKESKHPNTLFKTTWTGTDFQPPIFASYQDPSQYACLLDAIIRVVCMYIAAMSSKSPTSRVCPQTLCEAH